MMNKQNHYASLSSPLRGEVAGAQRKSIGVIGEAKAAPNLVTTSEVHFCLAALPPHPHRPCGAPPPSRGRARENNPRISEQG